MTTKREYRLLKYGWPTAAEAADPAESERVQTEFEAKLNNLASEGYGLTHVVERGNFTLFVFERETNVAGEA